MFHDGCLLFPPDATLADYVDSWTRPRCMIGLLIDVVAPAHYTALAEREQLVAWTRRRVSVRYDDEPWRPSLASVASEWPEHSPRGLALAAVNGALNDRTLTTSGLPQVMATFRASAWREHQVDHLLINAYWRVIDLGGDALHASKEDMQAIAGAMMGLAGDRDWRTRLKNVIYTVLRPYEVSGDQ